MPDDRRPSPLHTVAKTLNRIRVRGPREVLALGIERAAAWWSSSDVLVMFVRGAAPGTAQIPGYRFREAVAEDAGRYARDIGTESPKTFRARLSEGTRCFLVDDGKLVVHASWVTTAGAWTRELRAYLVPPEDDVYIYESFTRAEARGRGIYPFALRSIMAWAAESGVARLWVAVEEHNPASLRAVAKAGFEEGFRLPFARRVGRLRIGAPRGPMARYGTDFLSGSRRLSHL